MGSRRTEPLLARLLAEAQSVEVLLSDLVPVAEDIEAYWRLSAEMITLVEEIEGVANSEIGATTSDPEYVKLRNALSRLEGRIMELSRRADEEGA